MTVEVKNPDLYRPMESRMRVYEDVPLFSPWHGYGQFGDAFRRSGAINYYCLYYIDCVLRQALKSSQARYEIWELGVWQGASAMFLATMAKDFGRKLRLFDTFKGIPAVNPEHDGPLEGMFSDTSLEQVKNRIEPVGAEVTYHEGLIPGTFSGRENDVVAFAHVDLDIYDPILASCEFIYPRLMPGGAIVFDDYGWVNCPGARAAVEEYFAERNESIICVPTGQAFIIKSCS